MENCKGTLSKYTDSERRGSQPSLYLEVESGELLLQYSNHLLANLMFLSACRSQSLAEEIAAHSMQHEPYRTRRTHLAQPESSCDR